MSFVRHVSPYEPEFGSTWASSLRRGRQLGN
jgi:hypothetical protein